jgi:apolipoprotein N-acyltransferase
VSAATRFPGLTGIAVVAAGCLYVVGFAPFSLWPLAMLALAVLFGCWIGCGPRRAAWLGFLFGVGAFGAGVSWVFVSLHRYGNMETPLAAFTVVIFVLILSVYPALAGWLQARVRAGLRLRMLVVVPASWLVLEWLRGWLWTGFPWLFAGYSLIDTPMAGLAPLVGVLGLTALAAAMAGALALLPRRGREALAGLAVIAATVAGGFLAGRAAWTTDAGPPIGVALVQRNVGLEEKWAPGAGERLLAAYLADSRPLTEVDLIVWPEAAWPDYLDEVPDDTLERMRRHPADFLFGAIERERDDDGVVRFYNSAAAIGDGGLERYRKRHLVPFGEFIPFKSLLSGLLGSLEIPMSDLSAWRGAQSPIDLAGHPVAVSICYEDAFPNRIRTFLPGAQILVNISEDAWFGDSLAPHQRLQMARMRAIETGRPMLRAGNNGLSALIDRNGRVTVVAPQFVETVVRGSVQPATGATPWVRWGDAPLVGLALVVLAGLLIRRRDPGRDVT